MSGSLDILYEKSDNSIMEEHNPQVILSWKAPLRPYKKRSQMILRFYLAIAFLLSLIIFFFGDKILLIPIWVVLSIFYILTVTPPPEVENKITKFGIETAGITLRWELLSHFYFGSRFGFITLTVVGRAPYFYHLYLVIPNPEVKQNTIKSLSEHLVYQEQPHKNITDKMIDWLSSLIPEENDEAHRSSVFSTPQPASP